MPRWKQHSSRFDKNPKHYTSLIEIRRGNCVYVFDIIVQRNEARWSLTFDPFFEVEFPHDLGEMTGGDAKTAAKILATEAVQALMAELDELVQTEGEIPKSSRYAAAEWMGISDDNFRANMDSFGRAVFVESLGNGVWWVRNPFDEYGGGVQIEAGAAKEAREITAALSQVFVRELLAGVQSIED
jgi:hypothetical protein